MTTLTRSEDWTLKLRLYLEAQREVPFAWATNDCCTGATGWIKLATGVDVYAEFAGKYTDEASAMRAVKDIAGGVGVEAAAVYITAKFGMGEIPVTHAQRGDVVLFDGELGAMLGIVNLHAVYSVFPGETGLRRIKTLSARRAWKVG